MQERGFSELDNSDGYIKVTEFMQENVEDLIKEARDEQE